MRTKHVSIDGVDSEQWNIGTQRPWASVLRRGCMTHLAPNLLQQALQARRLALRPVCCRFCHLHDESPPAVRNSTALEKSKCPSCQRCDAAPKGRPHSAAAVHQRRLHSPAIKCLNRNLCMALI